MRLPSQAFVNANITSAFSGIQSIGMAGSILNQSNAMQSAGPVLLGGGGSSDQGAGCGGTSGGGGSGSRSPGPGGGGGGTGGFSGGAGTVGGPSSRGTCQKTTPAPPPDPDDSKDKAGPGPSPNKGGSGVGLGTDAVQSAPMPASDINPCEGGPTTINPNRIKGKPRCLWPSEWQREAGSPYLLPGAHCLQAILLTALSSLSIRSLTPGDGCRKAG